MPPMLLAASPLAQPVIAILILIIFGIAAAIMITRKLPAIITLPLMGLSIAAGTGLIQWLMAVPAEARISAPDVLQGVLQDGALMLHVAMIVAFFGGVISFLMQKSGTAESLVKQGAELIGDNPLGVAVFSMLLIAVLFTSIGGLGAIIMVAMVVLPMLATVGIQPAVAGGIMLIGISLGGIMNAGNWVIYTQAPLNVPIESVKQFAVVLFLLTTVTGVTFICVELYRSGVVRSLGLVVATIFGTFVGGAVLLKGISMLGGDGANGAVPAHVITLAPGETAALALPGETAFRLVDPQGAAVALASVDRGFWPENADAFDKMTLSYRASQPGTLKVILRQGENELAQSLAVLDNKENTPHRGTLSLAPWREAGITRPEALRVEYQPKSKIRELKGDAAVFVSPLKLEATPASSLVSRVAQWVTGIFLGIVVLAMFVDIRARIRRWRQQVVTIKWYAYLIPVIPLLLIMVYGVPPLTAFLIGVVYAVFSTLRPGSISLSIQSLIQGAATVIPAVMLMVGIGILIRAVLGPAGWSEAHGGAEWPVLAAIGPIFSTIVPSGPVGYVLVFGLAAPLALYRGPLNVWGLGYGIAALLLAGGNLSGAAVMAMLLTVGQIQGICDPTNTHNVWLANELRVDVQTLLWRTLPYIWLMVFVGLIIAAFTYMR